MSFVYDTETTPLEGTLLLEASAGTGKTYALERMVARLVSEGPDPLPLESILVVTYTNRAAREMKDRIRKILVERSAEAGRNEAERSRCAAALSRFDRAAIYTIHGFCQMVLSTWPFESGAPFRQDIDPGGESEAAAARSWLATLTEDDPDRSLLATAWESAGSAEELISWIARILGDDSVPPDARIRPDDSELSEFARFAEESKDPRGPLAQASEKLFGRAWSGEAMNVLFKVNGMARGKSAGSLDLIRDQMEDCRGISGIRDMSRALFAKSPLPPRKLESRKSHFLDLLAAGAACARGTAENPKDIDISGEAAQLMDALEGLCCAMEPYIGPNGAASTPPLESYVERYFRQSFASRARARILPALEEKKDAEGRWTYADLIRRVADAVAAEGSPLKGLLRSRFRAALIDEFQDTDPRQWGLFHGLFGGPGHLLALIGDPKQSIYGFRGTGLEAYNRAREEVDAGSIYRLDTNYRSVPSLVAAVNRIFEPVFSTAVPGNRPVGFDPVNSGKEDIAPPPVLGGSASVTLLSAPSESSSGGNLADSAAEVTVSAIRQLLQSGKGAPGASEIAVLVRIAAQGDLVLDRLRDEGIPAVLISNSSVFRQPAADLLRTFLEALEKPRDAGRWKTIFLGGFFSLPPSLVSLFEGQGRLDEFVERGGEWRELFLSGRSGRVLDSFFDFSVILSDWSEQAGRKDVAQVLDRPWPYRLLAGPGGERHWQDWCHLADLMQGKQAEGLREPTGLLRWLAESAENAEREGSESSLRLETEEPAVRVLTMHAAKGLEFPFVFVIDGLAKKSKRSGNDYRFSSGGQLHVDLVRRDSNFKAAVAYSWEETKRLLYVAFTRASRALWAVRPCEGMLSGLESLLAQSLGISSGSELPPHEELNKADAESLRGRLDEALEVLASEENPAIGFPVEEAAGTANTEPEAPAVPALAPLPDAPVYSRDPVTSSYTSLTRQEGHGHDDTEGDVRDVDRDASDIAVGSLRTGSEDTDDPIPLAGDRGALFGTLVHALFEETDFRRADTDEDTWLADPRIRKKYETLAGRHYPPDWYPGRAVELKKMVRNVLRAEIPEVGRLCDLEKADRRTEAEFLMAVPESSRIRTGERDVLLRGGFLKGFIDLVFRTGDRRWWVLDWKTNVPKNARTGADYDGEAVMHMMDSHEYHLQYELYLLALCRSLSAMKKEPVDWDSEIGGALYLFVRGMREGGCRGVFFHKPEKDRMLSLAAASGMEGVLK